MPDPATDEKIDGYPPSWYAATRIAEPPVAPLEGDREAEICIVGGGYSGLAVALHLARVGANVLLVEAERIGSQGLRVLLLGRVAHPVDVATHPTDVEPVALVVLDQKTRDDAKPTLDYFARQHVTVKVVSGDNARSVGAVARSLDLPGAEDALDARDLPEDATALARTMEHASVFGRVTPSQKRAMVHALQSSGHTVAMTGDGVNDVLALKDADIGVAMGSGSPATRAVAQIVLLDNRFATLPRVVAEGRRVIGNIERVSTLFLTKTVYSALLALMVGVPGLIGRDPLPYPFFPRHVTIIGWFTIGVPAFLLALAPNEERARTGFVRRVMRLAVPWGVVVSVCCFVTYLLAHEGVLGSRPDDTQASTAALITLITIALRVLAIVARPFALWKVALIVVMSGLSTLMFVLSELLAQPDVRRGVALAFGPGLAAEGFHFERAAVAEPAQSPA